MKILSDDKIFEVLVKYHSALCQSMPIQMPNQTEAIRKCLQAQLERVRELLDGMKNPYPDKDKSFFGENWASMADYYGRKHGFTSAIQAMKALLEE